MNVDFKLFTYKEPVETKEQKLLLIKNRNRSAYYPTSTNFVYNIITKAVYDAICIEKYREVRHELVMEKFGFNFDDIEPDEIIRFDFNTANCYDLKCQFTGQYRFSELGIRGLAFSGLYSDFPKYKKRADNLKSYDLDIIESYINYLEEEQAQIRKTEINLNLPRTMDLRKKNVYLTIKA